MFRARRTGLVAQVSSTSDPAEGLVCPGCAGRNPAGATVCDWCARRFGPQRQVLGLRTVGLLLLLVLAALVAAWLLAPSVRDLTLR
jgi:hypothetical protein